MYMKNVQSVLQKSQHVFGKTEKNKMKKREPGENRKRKTQEINQLHGTFSKPMEGFSNRCKTTR